ncbi:MAG: Hpt domain-containing protein, partial [Oligoflexia bacterium]|nr:Hpt domain-containing protein [Oligoflexia bacterium]
MNFCEKFANDSQEELFQEFVDESIEFISDITKSFVELETATDNKEIITNIFRLIHSIKGSCSFFGFLCIKSLCHKIENILDRFRNNLLDINRQVITDLLNAVDLLKEALVNVKNNNDEISDGQKWEKLLSALDQYIIKNIDSTNENWKRVFSLVSDIKSKIDNTSEFSSTSSALQELTSLLINVAPKPEHLTTLSSDTKTEIVSSSTQISFSKNVLEFKNYISQDYGEIKKINEKEFFTKIQTYLKLLIDETISAEGKDIVNESLDNFKVLFDLTGIDETIVAILKQTLNSLIDKKLLKNEVAAA